MILSCLRRYRQFVLRHILQGCLPDLDPIALKAIQTWHKKKVFGEKHICRQTQPEVGKPQRVLNNTWRCSRESMGCIDWSRKQHGTFLDKLSSKCTHEHQEDVTKHGRPQQGHLLSVCKATGGKEGRTGKLGP